MPSKSNICEYWHYSIANCNYYNWLIIDGHRPEREKRLVKKKTYKVSSPWRTQGTWCSAYGEWEALMRNGSDQEVIAAMTGPDENANRLRQSPPYAGFNHLFGEVPL
jgi:hypothetical protein